MEEKHFLCMIITKSKKQTGNQFLNFIKMPFTSNELLTWFFSIGVLILNIINLFLSQWIFLYTAHKLVHRSIKQQLKVQTGKSDDWQLNLGSAIEQLCNLASDVMSLPLNCLVYSMGMVIVYLPHRATVRVKWDTVRGTWHIISTSSNYY